MGWYVLRTYAWNNDWTICLTVLFYFFFFNFQGITFELAIKSFSVVPDVNFNQQLDVSEYKYFGRLEVTYILKQINLNSYMRKSIHKHFGTLEVTYVLKQIDLNSYMQKFIYKPLNQVTSINDHKQIWEPIKQLCVTSKEQ